VIGSVKFSAEKPLKLTYEHLLFQKKCLGSLTLAIKGKIREGRGWEGGRGAGRGDGAREGRGLSRIAKMKIWQP
jgi:hypothetical protein